MAAHFHQLRVNDVRRETAACISIAFEVPPLLQKEFAFTQGQNITIKANIEGEEIRRSYSICSSPLEAELRIAIKKVPGGKFSTWAHQTIAKGSLLSVLPPAGRFYTDLEAGSTKHYMAFAAGSGITPILSIIKTTLALEAGSHFTLFYGNKNRAGIIFREALEAIKNRFLSRFSIHHILSREKTDNPFVQGRIDTEKCAYIFRHLQRIDSCDAFFLCGPAGMIFTVQDFLKKNGVPANKIHSELFTAPGGLNPAASALYSTPVAAELEKSSRVTIQQDGISFDFDLGFHGPSILNAALSQGADLPFACKGGVCATCRAKLVKGEVVMDNNYALEPEEVAKGYILTCQSHPRTEAVSINFDQR